VSAAEGDRPAFGRAAPGAPPRALGLMAFLLAMSAGGLLWVSRAGPAARAPDVVVEVRGEVPTPGFHPVPAPPTVHAALRAAGADPRGVPDATLDEGTRLTLDAGGALQLGRMDELVVFGLPVDVNSASVEALAAVPGLRREVAEAVVQHRAEQGPFVDLDALDDVKGIGPATLEAIRPFLEARPPSP
jgi:competence protein ComEA